MAETTTRHEVSTDFTARDAGVGALLSRFSTGFRESGERLHGLRERFGEFRRETGLTTVGLLGVGIGLGALVHKAREAVNEFGRTEKGIASLLSGMLNFERGVSEIDRYTRAMVLAKEITAELDEVAARFVMPMESVGSVYRKVVVSAGALGLTQRQAMEQTVTLTAAAKRFGVSGEQAATTVARAILTKTVKGMDDFAISLRQAVGNLKGLSNVQAFERVQKALQGSVQNSGASALDNLSHPRSQAF